MGFKMFHNPIGAFRRKAVYNNESMQDQDIKNKRNAIINYLDACRGKENRIVEHIKTFIQSNGLDELLQNTLKPDIEKRNKRLV